MQHFSDWLYGTPFSHLLQTVSWIIPLVQIIHIICLAVLFTSMAMLNLRLLRVAGRRYSVNTFAQRFLPWLWGVLPILLGSGLLLVTAEPNRDLHNVAFYLKMSMIFISCLIMLGFQRAMRGNPDFWDLTTANQRLGKTIGLVSLLLWMSIVVAGRLIAYV